MMSFVNELNLCSKPKRVIKIIKNKRKEGVNGSNTNVCTT